MRRILPFIIVAVGLAALAVDLLPMNRPGSEPPERIETRLGLDLQGGLRGEYQVIGTEGDPITPEIMGTTRTIIEQRVNATGVAEPIVQTQGSDRISVEIPGVENVEEVRDLIGSTGLLQFVPIPAGQTPPGARSAHPARPRPPLQRQRGRLRAAGLRSTRPAAGGVHAQAGGRAPLQ